jgi:plasmid stability protein
VGSITIRDVPDEIRNALEARAARSGGSRQEYLRDELIALARRPDPDDPIDRVVARKRRTGVRLAADAILEHRDADRR